MKEIDKDFNKKVITNAYEWLGSQLRGYLLQHLHTDLHQPSSLSASEAAYSSPSWPLYIYITSDNIAHYF